MKKLTWSKWSKHLVLRKNRRLRGHLPETHPLSVSRFHKMIRQYGAVILKPSASAGGYGVFKVASIGSHRYTLHYQNKIRHIHGYRAISAKIRTIRKRAYLVQNRIPLASIRGRPYDIRVMLQRSDNRKWLITGMAAKVAGNGFIITNVSRSKGYVIPVDAAIRRSGLSKRKSTIMRHIRNVSLKSAECLSQSYPKRKEIGLDIGLDGKGRVWIIEANFAPLISLFHHLRDKTMYFRIRNRMSDGRRHKKV